MKPVLFVLALAALALSALSVPGCGVLPVEGGSQIISNVGQSALNALIAYAEAHGWTRAQTAQATNDAAAALTIARGTSRATPDSVSPEALEWARAYVAAGN